LKNRHVQSSLEVPTDVLYHVWIQVAVSEVKRPLRNRLGSETATAQIYIAGLAIFDQTNSIEETTPINTAF
jgi:hypothetical protein